MKSRSISYVRAGVLLMSMLMVLSAGATPISQPFYVVIDAADPVEIASSWPWVAVGDKFYGNVVYDATNVAATGAHSIGYGLEEWLASWSYGVVAADEYQLWGMEFDDPVGSIALDGDTRYAAFGYPMLYFMDGKLSGMDFFHHYDMPALENEWFTGSSYFAYGADANIESLPGSDYWSIAGTLVAIPEPSTILLIGISLLGLGAFRKKFRNK